ncbi:hypothetical protein BDW59DRAFT_30172 [Aspergillus cavernicola]|uniref:Uncharacterized protein n=1 Tax=Aspergillus cavernicola TaxID=176166 RepID=A0ABR4HE01_9EURO
MTEGNCEQASWTYSTNPQFLGNSCLARPASSFARGLSTYGTFLCHKWKKIFDRKQTLISIMGI